LLQTQENQAETTEGKAGELVPYHKTLSVNLHADFDDKPQDDDDEIESNVHEDDVDNQSEIQDDSTDASDTEEGIQEFHVDKGILCVRSRFFEAAFNGPWGESITNSVSLPKQSPNSFATYVTWLYREVVTVEVSPHEQGGASPDLLRLYALAEAVQDRNFADAIVDAMFRMKELLGNWYQCTAARRIYSFTPPGSLLRALHVDMMLYGGKAHDINIRHRDLPQEFIHDMFERLSSRYLGTATADTGHKAPTLKLPLTACFYHYHRPGACYKDKGLSRFVVVAVKKAPGPDRAQVTTS